MNLEELKNVIFENAVERNLYHQSSIESMLLHLVSEVTEVYQTVKDGGLDDFIAENRRGNSLSKYTPELMLEDKFKKFFEDNIKDSFQDELADIIILTLSICAYYQVDIQNSVMQKVRYNRIRDKGVHDQKKVCSNEKVIIPDPQFERAIREKLNKLCGDIYKDDLEQIKVLDVDGLRIANLQGIEYFNDLEVLDCSRNPLKVINLSRNLKLKELYCSNNQLCSLNLFNNIHLKELYCQGNEKLDVIDLSNNVNLECVKYSGVITMKKGEGK